MTSKGEMASYIKQKTGIDIHWERLSTEDLKTLTRIMENPREFFVNIMSGRAKETAVRTIDEIRSQLLGRGA